MFRPGSAASRPSLTAHLRAALTPLTGREYLALWGSSRPPKWLPFKPPPTGYGLNEMLAGHGISGIVVSSKYQDASVPVPQEKLADGGPFRGAKANYRAGAPPGRERPPASIAPARGPVLPRGQAEACRRRRSAV
jgi:hypothetical protein